MEDDTRSEGFRPVSNDPLVQRQPNDNAETTTAEPGSRQSVDQDSGFLTQTQTGPTAAASPHAFASQFYMTSPPHPSGRMGPYNMAGMANALPQAGQVAQTGYRTGHYSQGVQHRHSNQISSPPMLHHMPQMHPPYAAHPQMPGMANSQAYYMQQPQIPQYYASNQVSPTQAHSPMQPRQPMPFYPNQMVMNHHDPTAYYYSQPAQYPGQTAPHAGAMIHPGQYMASSPVTAEPRATSQTHERSGQPANRAHGSGQDDPDGTQGAVRGPPRKPRQSGHAIWIGNLPPQTDLMNLVHHVCKEAPGLVSLFLISKSNCAFANFKDEGTCVAAQQKLHDSRFQGIRLVSRLRKSTVEGAPGVKAPTGPSANSSIPARTEETDDATPNVDADVVSPVPVQSVSAQMNGVEDRSHQQDRFFILKSLTVEDLATSVNTGVWATQSHNEDVLNEAFKTAENVYLVFSANKSGEYFGYARMISQIDDDPAAAIEFAPKVQPASYSDLPKAIPTEATEYTPRGKIMDDSARGSIFWEAERDEADRMSETDSETSSVKSGAAEEEEKTWGKPFKLEWLSTIRLPFYRTRGLRNPWNSNREVKIARDGTELEPSVGRRLIGLFNRVQSPGPPAPGMMRPPMGAMGGFSLARPYGP